MRLIFISHSSADHALAESLARHFEASEPDVKTFVASRPGDIRADTEWLPSVQKGLRDADAYVVLLTVNSVLRPWVSFEVGAAWFSNRTCVLVRAGGLPPGDIPLPLSAKQVYALDVADDTRAVFRALGLQTTAIDELVAEAGSFTRKMKLAGDAEPVWEGVEFQGTYYAWAGPLLAMEDKAGVPCPQQLTELLQDRGIRVSFGNPELLFDHFGRGRCQLFATDKKSWRRPVVRGRQLLLVRRPEDTKE
jgi:hypothetical protein